MLMIPEKRPVRLGEKSASVLVARQASMVNVIVLKDAERDYSESLSWYSKKSIGVAEEFKRV
ncbi:hypothetical protein [Rhodopirellula islandica]|uniref:hypothetical protein n=1 Tax=Rhodopirellula islandica TaxID=595434 RepID=UPI001569B9CF|nr:hypothetical protein [Rhodopirellula islandica]